MASCHKCGKKLRKRSTGWFVCRRHGPIRLSGYTLEHAVRLREQQNKAIYWQNKRTLCTKYWRKFLGLLGFSTV